MKRQVVYFFCIGMLNFFLFVTVFKLFQNEEIYHKSIGLISENYERIGGWNDFEIKKVSKPFLQLKNENFTNWDAGIYKCISERMYSTEVDCYGKVRAAFFPLFPILWKVTHSTPISISIINYFLLLLSIGLLVHYLLNVTMFDKLIIFSILICLPSTIVYFIPYTEALFLFTMTIVVIGLLKNKYLIYFLGSFLLAMVRPATVFVLIAIICTELVVLIRNKNLRAFINELILKSTPFIAGYFCSILIQYMYSGSWTVFLEAQKYWAGEVQVINGISDWSVEGFGLSSFSIFLVCIPATLSALFIFVQWNKKHSREFVSKIVNYKVEYLLSISIFYIIGLFAFTLLTSGGNFHSFFRFTLASPPFYIALLIFINSLFTGQIKLHLASFVVLSLILILFLNIVEYGGERIQFAFFGMYLFIATSLFLLVRSKISMSSQIVVCFLIILLNTIWNTYLLNAFFSDGWIFT